MFKRLFCVLGNCLSGRLTATGERCRSKAIRRNVWIVNCNIQDVHVDVQFKRVRCVRTHITTECGGPPLYKELSLTGRIDDNSQQLCVMTDTSMAEFDNKLLYATLSDGGLMTTIHRQ